MSCGGRARVLFFRQDRTRFEQRMDSHCKRVFPRRGQEHLHVQRGRAKVQREVVGESPGKEKESAGNTPGIVPQVADGKNELSECGTREAAGEDGTGGQSGDCEKIIGRKFLRARVQDCYGRRLEEDNEGGAVADGRLLLLIAANVDYRAGGIHPLTSKSLSTRLMYSSGDSSG